MDQKNMKVQCLCGHENHIEMPLDDHRTVRIECTSSCRTARQLRLDITPEHQARVVEFGPVASVVRFPART